MRKKIPLTNRQPIFRFAAERGAHASSGRAPPRRSATAGLLLASEPRAAHHGLMNPDPDRIDDTVLALLQLTLHDGCRAWKGHDWDVLDRLHQKGLIHDPVGKAKSVVLTDDGLLRSRQLFEELFAR